MDGREVEAGEFAHTLRRQLYSEHLGLPLEEVEDPLDPAFVKRMTEIARV